MQRKELVRILGEHFGVKPQYLGAPSFNYKLETEEGTFIIDREGKVTLEESNQKVEFLVNQDGTVIRKVEQEETEPINFEVAVSMIGHTGLTLRNVINMISSKQPLIKKAFGLNEDIVDDDFITGMNEANIETLQDFKTALDDIGERSCEGIRFDFFEKKIIFKFYHEEEKRQAYIQLIPLINQKAKVQKYASPKCKPTDNEKFTFRTWLIRFGMKGKEYKEARKQLLENMEGNGAYAK